MAVMKTVHRLQLPYCSPEWPIISEDDENIISRHLIELLRPIGEYRKNSIAPSKRRREEKRQQADCVAVKDDAATISCSQLPGSFESLTIGFNSTTRLLEAISQHSRPENLTSLDDRTREPDIQGQNLGAVLVCRATLPALVTASTPLLIATASLAQKDIPPIRLVQLSQGAESRLAEALNQPRVGFIGVRITKDTDLLLKIVRAAVAPIQIPWLDPSEPPTYLPLKVENTVTTVGSKQKRKRRPSLSTPP